MKGDQLVERGATRLLELADRAAARGDGVGEWLSEELRDDAAFLRKLKPSLVKARAKNNGASNQAPTKSEPTNPELRLLLAARPAVDHGRQAGMAGRQRRRRAPRSPRRRSRSQEEAAGGPPYMVIVGAALVAGSCSQSHRLEGHAHPRD
jgi:hypothetical protein